MTLHRSSRTTTLVLALFAAPRLLALAGGVTPTSDADWYVSRAVLLAAGQGYQDNGHLTAFWPVGWPLLLSLGLRLGALVGAPTQLAIGVLNLGFAGVTAALILLLAERWATRLRLPDRDRCTAGLVALGAYALYPNAVLYVPLGLTEVAFTALLLAGVWLTDTGTGAAPGPMRLVGAGLVMGLATLVKAQSLILLPALLALNAIASSRNWRAAARAWLRASAIALAAAVLVIAPWTLRNHIVLGAWVPVSTNGGITLLTGNNDSANGGYVPGDPVVRALDARKAALGELAYDAQARRLGMDWIATHPARFAALGPAKLAHLWGPDGEGWWGWENGSLAWRAAPRLFGVLRLINQAWYAVLLAALVAAPWVLRRRTPLAPLVIAAFLSAIAVAFSGQSRFHFPLMPLAAILLGLIVVRLVRRHQSDASAD